MELLENFGVTQRIPSTWSWLVIAPLIPTTAIFHAFALKKVCITSTLSGTNDDTIERNMSHEAPGRTSTLPLRVCILTFPAQIQVLFLGTAGSIIPPCQKDRIVHALNCF
jgi:hypothetical protein